RGADQESSQDRALALPAARPAPARGLCPVGDLDRPARDLSHFRALDGGHCHRDVVDRADFFVFWPLIVRDAGQLFVARRSVPSARFSFTGALWPPYNTLV